MTEDQLRKIDSLIYDGKFEEAYHLLPPVSSDLKLLKYRIDCLEKMSKFVEMTKLMNYTKDILSKDCEKIDSEIKILEEEIAKIEDEKIKKAEAIRTIKQEILSKNESETQQLERLDRVDHIIKLYEDELGSKNSQIEVIRKNIEEKRGIISGLKIQIRSTESEISSYKYKISTKEHELSELSASYAKVQHHNNHLTSLRNEESSLSNSLSYSSSKLSEVEKYKAIVSSGGGASVPQYYVQIYKEYQYEKKKRGWFRDTFGCGGEEEIVHTRYRFIRDDEINQLSKEIESIKERLGNNRDAISNKLYAAKSELIKDYKDWSLHRSQTTSSARCKTDFESFLMYSAEKGFADRISTVRLEIYDLKRLLSEKTVHISSLRSKIDSCESEILVLNSEVAAIEGEISKKTEDLLSHESDKSSLLKSIKEIRDEIKKMKLEESSFFAELDSLESRLSEKLLSKEEIGKFKTSIEEDLNSLKSRLDWIKTEMVLDISDSSEDSRADSEKIKAKISEMSESKRTEIFFKLASKYLDIQEDTQEKNALEHVMNLIADKGYDKYEIINKAISCKNHKLLFLILDHSVDADHNIKIESSDGEKVEKISKYLDGIFQGDRCTELFLYFLRYSEEFVIRNFDKLKDFDHIYDRLCEVALFFKSKKMDVLSEAKISSLILALNSNPDEATDERCFELSGYVPHIHEGHDTVTKAVTHE